MNEDPCTKCRELLTGKSHQKHSELRRSGLSSGIGYHGGRDDEYFYICTVCGTRFVGDSCGIWLADK